MAFNADPEPVDFVVPKDGGGTWTLEIDTAVDADEDEESRTFTGGDTVTLEGRASLVLRRTA